MKCTRCANLNPADARFCQRCGEPLLRRCPGCATLNEPEANFCKHCGTALAESISVPASQGRPQLTPDRLAGERKPVTILFTDIVGSTSLAEKLDSEAWREIVSGAHRIVSEIVQRYDGTIAQLLGDGVLIYFGAPEAHEDDPQRAVRAALDTQAGIRDYARSLAGSLEDFQMRIGIHTGTVVVGGVGGGGHVEYLAVGDAVNLAARLQSAARPGGILISAAIARHVEHVFELRDLGQISLKGKSEPVQVFEPLTAKAAPQRGLAGDRLSSALVGRHAELESLTRVLGKINNGLGQIVAVFGDAGIGKSRLAWEARQAVQVSSGLPIRWLEGRAVSYSSALPFWTITQLLKDDLGLSDGDPEGSVLAALKSRALEFFGERAAEYAPYLAHLLGLGSQSEWGEVLGLLDGETLKRQILLSITAYFEALSGQHPLALVFEDLHWIDPSSLEALESLLPLGERRPLLLLLLSRLETEGASWRIRERLKSDYPDRYTEIVLDSLTWGEGVQIIENLLDCAELPEPTLQMMLGRADGNPFYLEELVHSLVERGAVVQEGGCWVASRQNQPIAIPDTLQGLLLARIDRLEEQVRRTLQLASVIGRSFLYRLLRAIDEVERVLDESLTQLQRLDMVREKTRLPELEYIFKHSLTQEAAYSSLLSGRKREFHRRVAEALESLFASQAEELYGLLAYHYDRAGEREKAIVYLLQAGDKARLENAFEEAGQHYRRAVELLDEAGDRPRLARTWLKIGLIHLAEFEFEAAHQAYETAFLLQKQVQPEVAETLLTETDSGTPRILRMATQTVFQSIYPLNPGRVATIPQADFVMSLFAGLVAYDQESNIVPHVARSWQVLDDGKRYLFHLRDDSRWTDGEPVSAGDFEFAWKHNLRTGTSDYPAGMLDDVVGARDHRLGLNPDPDSVGVRALDPWTFEVRLESPLAYFIYLVAHPVAYPLPRHIVNAYGEEWWLPPHGVYNGPFRLTACTPTSGRMERNLAYFGEFPGDLNGVEWEVNPVGDMDTLRRFQTQELDLCLEIIPSLVPDDIPAELVQNTMSMYTTGFVLNPLLPPMDDLRVRKALAHGLDIRSYLEKLEYAVLEPPRGGMIPSSLAGHSPELGLGYDLPKARRLLAEAGYPNGKGFPRP